MPTPAKNHSDGGFTLVELLIAIVILGVLAALAIPQFIGQRDKATGATARSDLRNAATIEEAQLADSGAYVSSLSALSAAGFKRSAGLQLGVAVSPSGYCEVASANGTYWWFDSSAGGVQSATTTALAPPSTATGICQSAVPGALG